MFGLEGEEEKQACEVLPSSGVELGIEACRHKVESSERVPVVSPGELRGQL